jgi:putative two-component system response regulator
VTVSHPKPKLSGSAKSQPGLAHILVTDDEPKMLRLVDKALGKRYRCEFATSTAQAHERLASTSFQLALCDIQMHDGSGLVLAEEITKEHPETAVVLIADKDDPEVAAKAFEFGGNGVHGYLVKPFWPGQLLLTVMNALRRRQLEEFESAHAQKQAIEELRSSRLETVERLARAIELHDFSTGQHVTRMAVITAFLARRLGLDAEFAGLLREAAPMHDVGKIGTPEAILRKPGPLNEEERKEMERHTVVGHEIFAGSESRLLQIAATIALTHHERYDGAGYPRGLIRDEIPLAGRITAVADVFDALLSERCYRPALGVEDAAAIIREGSGTHFDPRIADLLIDGLDEVLALRE